MTRYAKDKKKVQCLSADSIKCNSAGAAFKEYERRWCTTHPINGERARTSGNSVRLGRTPETVEARRGEQDGQAPWRADNNMDERLWPG